VEDERRAPHLEAGKEVEGAVRTHDCTTRDEGAEGALRNVDGVALTRVEPRTEPVERHCVEVQTVAGGVA
jgi:hypothetical protein